RTELYTLSLHDALPICGRGRSTSKRWGVISAKPFHLLAPGHPPGSGKEAGREAGRSGTTSAVPSAAGRPSPYGEGDAFCSAARRDRKSTRLNSSHVAIS